MKTYFFSSIFFLPPRIDLSCRFSFNRKTFKNIIMLLLLPIQPGCGFDPDPTIEKKKTDPSVNKNWIRTRTSKTTRIQIHLMKIPKSQKNPIFFHKMKLNRVVNIIVMIFSNLLYFGL